MDASRVVARFQGQLKLAYQEGKFVARDCRLTWSRNGWLLEELPQKGRKKLKRAELQNPGFAGWRGYDAYIDGNILRDAKLSKSDGYETIKQKMLDAYEIAADLTLNNLTPDEAKKASSWLRDVKWYENEVHFLKVTPEDTDPITVEGKDFEMKVEWTRFKVYDPKSDFQSHDPHYTMYESSAPASARKLYQMAKADPGLLKSVAWSGLSDWFTKNKIAYKTHFWQWH